jgi:hypothetical protein
LKDRSAQSLFESTHIAAERWLGQADAIGRDLKRACLDDHG